MTSPDSIMKRGPDFRIPEAERWKYGIMPPEGETDRTCPNLDTDSCPSGHMMVPCDTGVNKYYCKQCSDNTFQPNENWISDKCRLRRSCSKHSMRYADLGNTVRDAMCACIEGYHFPNEDQRACVPNKECRKGTAHGLYGNCESCLQKNMYSDTDGRIKECKPLTNCEKENRCTIIKSNGEADNVCGEIVRDLDTCEEITISSSSFSTTITITIVAGAALMIIILLTVFVFLMRRRHLRSLTGRKVMTHVEIEQLRQKVIKESDRSPEFCKKVLTTSSSFIEERIDRQIWGLAQELFRASTQPGHFEEVVKKYKDTQPQYTISGYLQEWMLLKGDTKDTVVELFRCLRQIKRDDIVNEICICLTKENDNFFQCQDPRPSNKVTLKDECVFVFFPCLYHQEERPSSPSCAPGDLTVENEIAEAGTKLLVTETDEVDKANGWSCDFASIHPPYSLRSNHPSPSAPELEDVCKKSPSVDNIKFNSNYSQPIQATS